MNISIYASSSSSRGSNLRRLPSIYTVHITILTSHVHIVACTVRIGGCRRRFDLQDELDEVWMDTLTDYDITYYLQDSFYYYTLVVVSILKPDSVVNLHISDIQFNQA